MSHDRGCYRGELEAELARAQHRLTFVNTMALERHGVRPGIACNVPLGRERVQLDARIYQPHRDGEEVFIVPALDEWGNLVDLCALRPDAPRRYWLRHDRLDVLGADRVRHAQFWELPLRIHETPLGWLSAGCKGACFLSWLRGSLTAQALRHHLLGIHQLVFDDIDFAEKIDGLSKEPEPFAEVLMEVTA